MAKTMDPEFFIAWRKRMGLTQAQYAHKTGDHLVTVKRWETGARKLPPHIGWIMAAIEHGLEPVGQEAMIEFDAPVNPRSPGVNPKALKNPPDPEVEGESHWVYERTLKKPEDDK